MAEFCNRCRPKIIGTIKQLMEGMPLSKEEAIAYDTAWSCEPDGICENCGYRYLKKRG